MTAPRPRFPTREALRARAQLEGAQVLLRGDAPPLALRRALEGLVGLLDRASLTGPGSDGPQRGEVLAAVRAAVRAALHPDRVQAAWDDLRGGPLQRLRPDSFVALDRALEQARSGASSGRLTAV